MAEKEIKLGKEKSDKQVKINDIKQQLSDVNAKKEAAFQKRKTISQQINNILQELKEAKSKRNSFTKQVRTGKERRDSLNEEIKQKLAEMKVLQQQKIDIIKKKGIKIDPAKIKSDIEKLELRVETEVLPFSLEQRIMKQIGELRKQLNEYKEVSDIFEKIYTLNKDIKKLKIKADETHKKVQTRAGESQVQHESLIESSKSIDDLRKKEDEALKEFVTWKTKHTELSNQLRGQQGDLREVKTRMEGIEDKRRERKQAQLKKELKAKEMTVEEKIKKGEKLTTEDLLIFQAEAQMASMTIKKRSKKKK